MRARVRTVVIVGAGFSGTALALQLLRDADARLRVSLIDCAEYGRGVAYRRDGHGHLLNVPAERMSVYPEQPLHFVQYAAQHGIDAADARYLPRAFYGDYLRDSLDQAAHHESLEFIRGKVNDISRIGHDGPWQLVLHDDRKFFADDVVLASGDPPASDPPGIHAIGHSAYVRDAHVDGAVRADTGTLLLLGSGLTMADTAAAAAAVNPQVRIHVLSRHGLLPRAQPLLPHGASSGQLSWPGNSVAALLRSVRDLAARQQSGGGHWIDAINALRPMVRNCGRA